MRYIHELKKWPKFQWDEAVLSEKLAGVRHLQGRLIGQMEGLGFQLRAEANLQSLTEEILKSNEIEGEKLDRSQVRSSLAKRLGINMGGVHKATRHVEGVVELMIDATQKYSEPLTMNRLYNWHAALFPTGRSGIHLIRVGQWRDDKDGPMQVISGPVGKSKVHFQAPEAKRLPQEMKAFLAWFNATQTMDLVLKAAIAHLWFITIHPFEDGNGRIARAITELVLARSENTPQRFYSMSAQIHLERSVYYNTLESTQKGDLDATDWIEWFLDCLGRAIQGSEMVLSSVLKKNRFWEAHREESFNERQKKILNRFLDGLENKLSSSKWASLAKCSQDTASRDIHDLLQRKIIEKNRAGGRSTSYSLADSKFRI